jgi:hypothetical protein
VVQAISLTITYSYSSPDMVILNFALTLEHLENAFYSEALGKFTSDDFSKAGYPAFARGRFSQIAAHEAAHVTFLQQALGDNATMPCTYRFPYADVKGFVGLSAALEAVGAAAYTGAAKYISNKVRGARFGFQDAADSFPGLSDGCRDCSGDGDASLKLGRGYGPQGCSLGYCLRGASDAAYLLLDQPLIPV